MDTHVLTDEQAVAKAVGDGLCNLIARKPDAVICMAAGHSSLGVFSYLAARQKAGTANFSRIRVVELDEWLGMDAADPEGCTGFLSRYFFGPLGLAEEQLALFDAKAKDMPAECGRMGAHIKAVGGIDYMLLGMGQNGHLGLNEPGCALNAGPHVTTLSETTKKVGQKYFTNPRALEGGITLGVADILAARKLDLVVCGAHKREIVARFFAEKPGNALPASVLKNAAHATLYLDEAAAQTAAEQGLVQ